MAAGIDNTIRALEEQRDGLRAEIAYLERCGLDSSVVRASLGIVENQLARCCVTRTPDAPPPGEVRQRRARFAEYLHRASFGDDPLKD